MEEEQIVPDMYRIYIYIYIYIHRKGRAAADLPRGVTCAATLHRLSPPPIHHSHIRPQPGLWGVYLGAPWGWVWDWVLTPPARAGLVRFCWDPGLVFRRCLTDPLCAPPDHGSIPLRSSQSTPYIQSVYSWDICPSLRGCACIQYGTKPCGDENFLCSKVMGWVDSLIIPYLLGICTKECPILYISVTT